MDIKQLSYFVAIAEEDSISAAARKLHIAQPPLSHQLKSLEEELGVKLVKRGARRTALTDAGKILYKRANNILDLTHTTVKELDDFGNGMRGTLRLGTVSSSGAALLSSRMTAFAHKYPKIRFEIHEGNTFELIELLMAGIIEIGIVRTPFQSERTECIFLEKEPMIAAGNPHFFEHPEKGSIPLLELKNKPLIFYRRFSPLIQSCCHNAGFEPNIFCLNDDARTTLMWASAGLGVAIVPKSASRIMMSEKLIYPAIEETSMITQIAAIWRKDEYLSFAAKNFLKEFNEND